MKYLDDPKYVFSTCVEVILQSFVGCIGYKGILHVCGGDPQTVPDAPQLPKVFSTCVEVIPSLDVYHEA